MLAHRVPQAMQVSMVCSGELGEEEALPSGPGPLGTLWYRPALVVCVGKGWVGKCGR